MTYFDVNRMSQTLWPTCKSLLTEPRRTFEQMPQTEYYKNGLALLSLIVFAAALLSVPFMSFWMIVMLPVVWILVMLTYWTWAAYLAWAVRKLGKQQLHTAHAFQLSVYASIPLVVGVIPVIGILSNLWSLYLTWLALVANVKVKEGTALFIVLVPVLLLMFSLAILIVLLIMLLPQVADMLGV